MRHGNAHTVEKLLGDVGFSANVRLQDGNRCPQMGRRIVKKLQYERVPFERLLDDAPLNAEAAAVNEANLCQPRFVRLVDVLFDHRWDVARRERVEIEHAFDGYPDRVLILHRYRVGIGFS